MYTLVEDAVSYHEKHGVIIPDGMQWQQVEKSNDKSKRNILQIINAVQPLTDALIHASDHLNQLDLVGQQPKAYKI